MAKKRTLSGRSTPTPAARRQAPAARRAAPAAAPAPARRPAQPAVEAARPAAPVRPEGIPRHTGDRRPTEAEVENAKATIERARRGVVPRDKVQAKKMGFYDHKRRRVGDVFTLKDPKHFSRKWMKKVSPDTPEKITTGQEELRRQHDEILGARMEGRSPATASMEPLDDDVDNPLDT